MNQPAAVEPTTVEPTTVNRAATLDNRRRSRGTMHLTVSQLIEHELVQDALERQVPPADWNKGLARKLSSHHDSEDLAVAIESMFDDIADRKQGLFAEDFLIDTASFDPDDGLGPNVCAVVDLHVPQQLRWSAEGNRFRAEFADPPHFDDVLCRAFWVVHSNLSLSYHLSFQFHYEHTAAHYYALSLVQKTFFPTEVLPDSKQVMVTVQRDCDPVAANLPMNTLHEYVMQRFQFDAAGLFDRLIENAGRPAGTRFDRQELAEVLVPAPANDDQAGNRTCVAIMEDSYFFRLLQPDIRLGIADLDAIVPTPEANPENTKEIGVYREDVLDGCSPDHLALYFLSGYFQNVLDFLRQDSSEVQDGTDPIYPPPDQKDPSHFIIYATPSTLYEVVTKSRSLKSGREWIGTCPYLFLVHLMTLHNEGLVRRYERRVHALVDHLETVGLLHSHDRPVLKPRKWHSDETFGLFRGFRLDIFDEVDRHRYFNVLRYDTEKAYYESIERVRGIHQREQYWTQVVADLRTTVDDLREYQKRRVDERRNKLLGLVTVVGVLQVAFQILDYTYDKDAGQLEWAVLLAVVALVLGVVVFWRGQWQAKQLGPTGTGAQHGSRSPSKRDRLVR